VTTARTRSVIPWLLLAVVALIIYGSLYPFNFKPDAIEGGLFEAMRQLDWARAGRGDRISNVLLYLPLGFCLFLWLNSRFRRRSSILLAAVMGTTLSLTIEMAQVYVSSRVPSLTDLTLNCSGTVLGAAGGLAWNTLNRLIHQPARAEKLAPDPGAIVLIVIWLLWRLIPFVPQLDLGKLKAALQPLFDPDIDAVSVFMYLTCWLVVNQAVVATARRPQRLEMLLLLIAAVLVGRLLLPGESFVAAELLALLLLPPMLVLMHQLKPRPRRAALVFAVVTALILDTLAPFDFSSPAGRFDFWPFMTWLRDDPLEGLHTFDWLALFGKLFLFSALIWTLRTWGTSILFAGSCAVMMSLAIEIAQLWLPHQNASITDPLLAAGMAWLMYLLYQRSHRPLGRGTISRGVRNR